MSDHLPECPGGVRPAKPANGNGPEIQYVIFGSGICICDRLRACEQRVRQSAATLWDRTSEQMAAARVEGIRAGLDAAREAVLALPHYRAMECDPGLMPGKHDDSDPWLRGYLVDSDEALAAIDELREGTK